MIKDDNVKSTYKVFQKGIRLDDFKFDVLA